jgi:hypothetical protein
MALASPSLCRFLHRVALRGFDEQLTILGFFLLGFAAPTLALWIVGLLRLGACRSFRVTPWGND